jgi:hypothetical protein
MMVSTSILTWFGGILTLCVLSFLYKETKAYRFAEYTYISVAVGHSFLLGINALRAQTWEPIKSGNISIIIIVLFSLLIITQPFTQINWLARFPNAVLIGIGTGVSMYGAIGSDIISMIQSTIRDGNITTIGATLTGYFTIIGTISVLVYFFFTVDRDTAKGSVNILATLGRYFMMAAFGAVFANIILSRSTLLFSRLLFIFQEWLGII